MEQTQGLMFCLQLCDSVQLKWIEIGKKWIWKQKPRKEKVSSYSWSPEQGLHFGHWTPSSVPCHHLTQPSGPCPSFSLRLRLPWLREPEPQAPQQGTPFSLSLAHGRFWKLKYYRRLCCCLTTTDKLKTSCQNVSAQQINMQSEWRPSAVYN